MPAARIIPCLDVADGRVVKGVQFKHHRDIGDIVDHALRYRDEGADELVFYDITASADGRSLDPAWVRRVSAVIDIPFSVAGGIGDVETAARCLAAGADKVSINSPALARPALIAELAEAFGRQCVVLGIDSLRSVDGWRVKQYTGRPEATADAGRETIAWARAAVALGAGEIVLNCMTATGCGRAMTSTSSAHWSRRLTSQSSSRAAPEPPRTSPKRSLLAPAGRLPRACSTTAASQSPA